MKKNLVVIIASLMLSVAISFFAKSNDYKIPLLDNIEALANGDDGGDALIDHNFTPMDVVYYVQKEVRKTRYMNGYAYPTWEIIDVPVYVVCCMPSGGINWCDFSDDLENHCDRVDGWWSPFN